MNLILLVGTNPLPNYVTALFIKNTVELVFLVHSDDNSSQKGTQNIANWLKEGLVYRDIAERQIALIPLTDASSAKEIRQNLDALLLPKLKNGFPTHLNYTGGTKAMSVHVHAWLASQIHDPQIPEVIFSYLDARSNRLRYDYNVRSSSCDLRNDAASKIEKIDELLQLHGYKRKLSKESSYPAALAILGSLVENDTIQAFMSWKTQFRTLYYQNEKVIDARNNMLEQFQKKEILDAVQGFNRSLDEIPFARPLLQAFPDSILGDDGYLWIPDQHLTNTEINRRIVKPLHGFLDGRWLEQHVMTALASLACEYGLLPDQYGLSLKAHKPDSKDFELDIFVLRGYQLTGISISTAGTEKCKNKAFEVIHRVQQIGGDESRAILIGKLDDSQVSEMQQDISFLMTGTSEEHFMVIGINQWKKTMLAEILRRFIWQ